MESTPAETPTATATTLDANGSVLVALPPSTPVCATPAVHTAATVTLAAVSAKKHHLTQLSGSIVGTGTAPSGANGIALTVTDDSTVVLSLHIAAFGAFSIPLPGGGLVAAAVNKAMTITLADPGASNTGEVNVASYDA